MTAFDPRITAHRGWTQSHPENSLAALAQACAEGCGSVEFDVRRTADHQWVVYHDADLSRLHDSPLRIADHELAELRQFAPIPLLDEALEIFPSTCLPLVEIKEESTDGIDALIATLVAHRRRTPLVTIARGTVMPPALLEAPIGEVLLFHLDWDAAIAFAEDRAPGLAGFDLPAPTTTDPQVVADYVNKIQRTGRKLCAFTINEPALVRLWLAAGADWVVTDNPWLL